MQIVSLGDNCMKCQILFSWKNKKNITILSPAESACSMISVSLLAENFFYHKYYLLSLILLLVDIFLKPLYENNAE